MLLEGLRQLRRLAGEHAHEFRSEAFERFFAMIAEELDDAYLASVERHLGELRFRGGLLMSAGLGKGNKGARYVLHRPPSGAGWGASPTRSLTVDARVTATGSPIGTRAATRP